MKKYWLGMIEYDIDKGWEEERRRDSLRERVI